MVATFSPWRAGVQIPSRVLISVSAGHRRAQVAVTHPHSLCRFNSCPTHCFDGLVAQLAEQDSLKVEVQGSTPCGATVRNLGVSSNGKTVGLHPANEGSTPSTVHFSALVVKGTSWLPPKEQVQVRLLAGVLFAVLGVCRRHATVRRSKVRFDSSRGYWPKGLPMVGMVQWRCMRPCDRRGAGS